MCTDMLLVITSTSDELLRNVNIDDLEWCWTLKILFFSDFFVIFACKRVHCDEMDGGRPRIPANRNCYRLSRISWALAQISCFLLSFYPFWKVLDFASDFSGPGKSWKMKILDEFARGCSQYATYSSAPYALWRSSCTGWWLQFICTVSNCC